MINMQGSKGNAVAQEDGPSFTLAAMHGHDVHSIAIEDALTFQTRHYADRGNLGGAPSPVSYARTAGAGVGDSAPCVAFSCKDYGADASQELAHNPNKR